MFNQSQLRWLAVWLLRVALAFSFLSAVADRFGLWGRFGVAGVAWGDFERFSAYTGQLLWFLPSHLVLPAAMLATVAELIVAGGLLAGWRLHSWAFAAAALLLSFALAMTCVLGVKVPIDYSVWTAAAAAFLLGVVALREQGADGARTFGAEAPQTETVRLGSRDSEGGQFTVNHRDFGPAVGPSHSPSRTRARQVSIPQPNKQ
jgi:hypothetical protein